MTALTYSGEKTGIKQGDKWSHCQVVLKTHWSEHNLFFFFLQILFLKFYFLNLFILDALGLSGGQWAPQLRRANS